MTTRWRKLGIRATAGLAVAAAPVAAACSSGPSYEDWAATDGAAGRINLEEVQNAFQESESVTEFEKRVNEIFEGDGSSSSKPSRPTRRLSSKGGKTWTAT